MKKLIMLLIFCSAATLFTHCQTWVHFFGCYEYYSLAREPFTVEQVSECNEATRASR